MTSIYPRLLIPALLALQLSGNCLAGDEDMMPGIYQMFDPETGFMIPVDEMPPPEHKNAPNAVSVVAIPTPSERILGTLEMTPGNGSRRKITLIAGLVMFFGVMGTILRTVGSGKDHSSH